MRAAQERLLWRSLTFCQQWTSLVEMMNDDNISLNLIVGYQCWRLSYMDDSDNNFYFPYYIFFQKFTKSISLETY